MLRIMLQIVRIINIINNNIKFLVLILLIFYLVLIWNSYSLILSFILQFGYIWLIIK
jgi:hypothetical protein